MAEEKKSEAIAKAKSKIKISVSGDDYNANDFLFCWDRFGSRPNRTSIHGVYSTRLFNVAISKYILDKNTLTDIIPDENGPIVNEKILAEIDERCYVSYIVADRNTDDSFIETVTFYYKNGYEGVESIIEELYECSQQHIDEAARPHKLNTLSLSQDGLETEPVLTEETEPEIDSYYASDTFKELGKAIKKIKKSERGLAILHGERGTGKTSAIKYISSKLERTVIFIPNNMIDHTINNPEFRKFLKKFESPILVIDDCEMLLGEIFSKSSMFSNNLLQLVDGFLAESINTTIIAIFNVEREDDIDHSLLDCNSLIEVVEFGKLSEKESNELAKLVESGKKYKGENRLVDIVKKRSARAELEMGF